MKKSVYLQSLLSVAVLLLSGCSGSDELSSIKPPEELSTGWNAVASATHDSITVEPEMNNVTRAAFSGGNTDRFAILWDQGDKIHVYKGNDKVGELTPPSSQYGVAYANLSGSLTGSFSEGEELYFYTNGKSVDFTGQTGTLQSVSSKAYAAKLVPVSRISGNTLYFDDVFITQKVGYARFYLTDKESGDRLHPQKLELLAISGGNLVLTGEFDGLNIVPSTTSDVLTVNQVYSDGEYPPLPYVAIATQKSGSANVCLKIKVTLANGDIYIGPHSGQNRYAPGLAVGTVGNCRRELVKTTPADQLNIVDVPPCTFTGYEIEPSLIVKDGETILTSGDDYSVEYSDNVDVGSATATITGLAERGELVTTPYLGTQDKTFQIVKATPVIVMDDATVTLVNNTNPEQNTATRTVTRVYIDNSAYTGIADLEILGGNPYSCTVHYTSSDENVATVDQLTGQVTAVGPGTCTITATVLEADNWLTNSTPATYTINVEQEVNGQNSVNPWTSGGEPEGGKIYVE